MKIYLASKSPRRKQLLEQIRIEFDLIDVDVDEHWDGTELPRLYVERLALEKARAGAGVLSNTADILVIGADTSVVLDQSVLGKADVPEQAAAMLRQLSGRCHDVYSAVAVVCGSREAVKTNISHVAFKPLTVEEIVDYCETGEPLGKAGGYAIQGRAAAFVSEIHGSYSGIVGLPLFETRTLLDRFRY